MDLTRRSFLKGLLGLGAVAAAPKIFIDMAPAWKKHDELYLVDYESARWHNLQFAAKAGEITTEELNSVFQRVYGPYVDCIYSEGESIIIERPKWDAKIVSIPVSFEG